MVIGKEEAMSSSPSSCLPQFARCSCFMSLACHFLWSPRFCVCFVFCTNIFLAALSCPSWLMQSSQQPEGYPHGLHGLLGPSSTHSTHSLLPSHLPMEGPLWCDGAFLWRHPFHAHCCCAAHSTGQCRREQCLWHWKEKVMGTITDMPT